MDGWSWIVKLIKQEYLSVFLAWEIFIANLNKELDSCMFGVWLWRIWKNIDSFEIFLSLWNESSSKSLNMVVPPLSTTKLGGLAKLSLEILQQQAEMGSWWVFLSLCPWTHHANPTLRYDVSWVLFHRGILRPHCRVLYTWGIQAGSQVPWHNLMMWWDLKVARSCY